MSGDAPANVFELADALRAQWSGEFVLINGKLVVTIEEENRPRVLAELREMLAPFGWQPGRTLGYSFSDGSKAFVALEVASS